MTPRKRIRIAVWIVLIVIAGVAVISFVHPFHTRIPCGGSRLVAVSIIEGNLRFVHLSAESNMSYVQDSPLVEYADHWEHVPTSALTWNQNGQVIFRNTPIGYVAFGVSLIRPIVAFILVVWAVKRRRPIAASMREITAPSDRQHVGLPGRVIRRSVIAILCLAALLAGGTWAVCYIGLHVNYKRRFAQNTLRLSSPHRGSYSVTFGRRPVPVVPFLMPVAPSLMPVAPSLVPVGPFLVPVVPSFVPVVSSLTIHLSSGQFQIGYWTIVPAGTVVRPYDLRLGGFRFRQCLDNEKTVSVKFPCWAPVFLFSAWPIIAFLRGPYRRAKRCAEGFRFAVLCVACGYNLTGNESGVCPECGRAI